MTRDIQSISRDSSAEYNRLTVWVLTLLCSVCLAVGAGYVTRAVYHPDIAQLSAKANELLIGAAATRPEPVEALITRICIVVFGCSVPGFYYLVCRLLRNGLRQGVPAIACILAAALPVVLLFIDFGATNPFSPVAGEVFQNDRDNIAATNFAFFFDGFFLGNFLPYYIVVFLPLTLAFFLVGVRKRNWDKSRLYPVVTNYIGYTVAAALLAAIFIMNTYEFPYTYENAFDFDTVYYSMTQVFAGSPMLVNDFTNTYGLYPHFLNPLFQLTGLSILKFSGVMSLLVIMSFLLNFLVLRHLVADRVILFLGFLTVLFFPYLDSKMAAKFDSYFAMYPIRYIVPSVMLFAALRYFERGATWLYYAIFLFLGFAVLWNPEMGLVSIVAWTAGNVYKDLLDTQGGIAWLRILRHGLASLLSVVIAFAGFAATVRMVYGAWPDLSLLFRPMKVFGELGFNMLPMVLVHPWNLVVLILLLGYLYSIAARAQTVTIKSIMVFMLTMTALGFFLYFQGRSHNWSFSTSSGFAIMLLVILGDELWSRARVQRNVAYDILFAGFLLVISFSLPEVVYGAPAIAKLAFPEETKTERAAYQQMIESNREFISSNTAAHEKILILTGTARQGLYFDGGKRVSAFNPTTMEMFFNASVPRLEQVVRDGPEKIFIEAADCRFGYLVKPLLVLSANYEMVAKNGNMAMLKRRANCP